MKPIFLQASEISQEQTLLLLALFALIVLIVLGIFYIQTLASTLQIISDENRKIPSSNMWLLLVPVFNLIYHFIVVGKLGESLSLEFKKKGIYHSESRPGFSIGVAAGVLNIASILPDELGILSAVASVICWVIYWIRISSCKASLLSR
ncbi:MAG: hypothetical protein GC192_15275 [Bacteroidetes bacterium]|nr:hypothetical protein [Bacteroidota bacterium]